MNAKDKIITYLETHKPASKKELIAVTKLPVNRINQVVRDLLESGQLEIHSVTNKVNHYRLTDLHNQRALDMIRVLGYIASFESEDIDGDNLELRFETEDGFDTGCTISITSQCQDASDVMQQLLNELEAADKRIAELEARTVTLPSERFRYGESDYDDGYVNGWNAHGIETKSALRAAGIVVKGE